MSLNLTNEGAPEAATRTVPALTADLGETMMSMLVARHSQEAAEAFARAVTTPTLPGTPARALSDRAWELLTARLGKLVGEAA